MLYMARNLHLKIIRIGAMATTVTRTRIQIRGVKGRMTAKYWGICCQCMQCLTRLCICCQGSFSNISILEEYDCCNLFGSRDYKASPKKTTFELERFCWWVPVYLVGACHLHYLNATWKWNSLRNEIRNTNRELWTGCRTQTLSWNIYLTINDAW